jgi:hypothetical protein
VQRSQKSNKETKISIKIFRAVINKPIFLNKKDKPALVNRKIGEEGRSP